MLSPAEEAYKRLLAEKLLNNRSRILAFRNKPPEPEGIVQQLLYETLTSSQTKPARKCRHIPQVCKLICCFKHIFRIFFNIHHSQLSLNFQSSERTLDAPGIVDDFYLNILDWGCKNVMSIALGNTLYLWNSADGSIMDLVTIDEDDGPITSVSWSCDGQWIAVGLNSSDIQLWDTSSNRMVSYLEFQTLALYCKQINLY